MARKRSLVVVTIVLTVVFGVIFLRAEQATNQTPALRVTTRLVMLDVVATDKDGKPVTDLKQDDFSIEDSGKKQKISIFGLEQPGGPAKAPSLPQYVYSNRPEYNMPSGALNLLLVDGINTSYSNQTQVREQLIKYIGTQMSPGQQTAVYALGSHLIKLQDFTGDPAILLAAISSLTPKLAPVASSTIAPTNNSAALASGATSLGNGRGSSGIAPGVAQGIQEFMGEQNPLALQVRIGVTLTAMRELAHILGGHSGRKNLIWVTGSLPFSMIPEQNQVTYEQTRAGNFGQAPVPNEISNASFANQIQQSATDEVKRTAALMTDSQISIYPVDARGLVGSTLIDASSQGTNSAGLLQLGADYGQSVSNAGNRLFSSQATLQEMAQQTGGRAFYNRNDIDHAVAMAASDGSTYYSIGYYPDKKKFDGSFHKFKVSVSRPGVSLRFRPGYFAIDPAKRANDKEREAELSTTLRDNAGSATMVTFDARVAPPPPGEKVALPVQFLVKPDTITAEDAKDGNKSIDVDFYVAAFTRDGKMVANNGKAAKATISSDQFAQLQQKGLFMPVEIGLTPGDYELRLAVRDNHTGYLGTLTVPVTLKKPGA